MQRLFCAIAASVSLKVFGGDAKDAFAHSPGPEMDMHLAMDNAHAEWHEQTFSKKINQNHVLPIKRALQGHPKSGRLWKMHINAVLQLPELNSR